MIKTIKQVFRSIQKQPLISLVNIFGLALGLFIFLLIDRYIAFENSFDDFHPDSKSIFRVATTRYANGEVFNKNIGAMPPLKPMLEDHIEGLQSSTLIYNDGSFVVQNPSNNVVFEEEKAYYADKSFFDVFGFSVLSGNPNQALDGPRKAAISESMALKYFGTEDVVGETLKTIGQIEVNYQITAVYSDPPANSHFKPDLLLSFDSYLDVVHPDWAVRTNWIWNDFPIYIKVPEQDQEKIQSQINQMAQDTWGSQYKERNVDFHFELQPIRSIHTNPRSSNEFETGTDQGILTSLRTVSWLTLILAWINFINLSTTQAIGRAKEVGIRKVAGASRSRLVRQFLTEFSVINLLATAAALLLLFAFEPLIPTLLGFDFLWKIDLSFWLMILALFAGSMLVGLYPSLIVSSFNTRVVIKGKAQTSKRGALMRTALVYIQFIITPIMIGGAVLVHQQTNHLMNREIGVDVNQVISIGGPRVATPNMQLKEDYFKEKLTQSSNVSNASNMMLLPGESINWKSNFRVYGDSIESQYMTVNLVEYDFEKVLDFQLLAGRSFSSTYTDSVSIIINESAARMWGYAPQDILNKTLWWRYSPNYHHFDKKVIGVIADHKQLPYSDENTPMVFSLRRYTPASFAGTQFLVKLKYSGKKGAEVFQTEISDIQEIWQELFPGNPFNYSFLDDEFEQKFLAEIKFGKLFSFFSLISILIAAMGLFGLSSYSILIRTKEFGIRKSLGASTRNIAWMIINQYLKLIGMAYIFSLPLLFFIGTDWLENYSVRINLNYTFFLVPILISSMIGLISIIQQTIKVSIKNPIESLRYE